jgi:hypothetical protein
MSFPPGTEMFQFPGFASTTYVFSCRYPCGWVSPFGCPRINACSRLPVAFRSVPRPSSPPGAKASTECPSFTYNLNSPSPSPTTYVFDKFDGPPCIDIITNAHTRQSTHVLNTRPKSSFGYGFHRNPGQTPKMIRTERHCPQHTPRSDQVHTSSHHRPYHECHYTHPETHQSYSPIKEQSPDALSHTERTTQRQFFNYRISWLPH